jgi:hypothetical protein
MSLRPHYNFIPEARILSQYNNQICTLHKHKHLKPEIQTTHDCYDVIENGDILREWTEQYWTLVEIGENPTPPWELFWEHNFKNE